MFDFNFLGQLLTVLFVQPLVNLLVVLYALLGHNFVLAMLAATVLVQLVTWPLTLKSLSSSKKMQQLQSSEEWKEAQKKYAKDREKMAQVTMELYRKNGINPAAGCVPTLLQFPLLIAFYQAINILLAVNPETLLDLTRYLYRDISFVAEIAKQTIPLQSTFLWMNLARPDPFYVMPVMVAASTWISQKTMSMPSADAQQSAINNQMQIMMPVMFGFFALNFPSGLAAYWIISSVVRMVFQGFTQGWNFVLPTSLLDHLPGARKNDAPRPKKNSEKNAASASTPAAVEKSPAPKAKADGAVTANGNKSGGSRKRTRRQARRG